jgi:hypothetical protein
MRTKKLLLFKPSAETAGNRISTEAEPALARDNALTNNISLRAASTV